MRVVLESTGEGSVLSIVGNDQESALCMGGVPIQYSWFAEVGTTMRYFAGRGLAGPLAKVHDEIQERLARGLRSEADFVAVSEFFVALLGRGPYECGYYELHPNMALMKLAGPGYSSFRGYGGIVDLTATQSQVDKKLVKAYKARILKGERPVMVALHVEHSFMFYILDGHHKFQGYREARIEPRAIFITLRRTEERSADNAIALAKSLGCTSNEFFESIRKEKEGKNQHACGDLAEVFTPLALGPA